MRIIDDKIVFNGTFFICPYCGGYYRALAYHTRQVHMVSGKQLRKNFGLPMNYSLQVKDLKERRREAALENNMDQQLIKAGKKTRFLKGVQQKPETVEAIRFGHIKTKRKIVEVKLYEDV